jgi:hypothetical protein
MTRPELPPGWSIAADWLRRMDHVGLVCVTPRGSIAEQTAEAWRIWSEENPAWAAYLAHLESSRNPSAERVLAARAELRAKLGYPPSLQVIGERVGMSGEGVRLVLKALGEPTSYVAERRAVREGKQS